KLRLKNHNHDMEGAGRRTVHACRILQVWIELTSTMGLKLPRSGLVQLHIERIIKYNNLFWPKVQIFCECNSDGLLIKKMFFVICYEALQDKCLCAAIGEVSEVDQEQYDTLDSMTVYNNYKKYGAEYHLTHMDGIVRVVMDDKKNYSVTDTKESWMN
ncbi:MAG TPA: hypothetical protein VJ869_02365, partial [Sphaerochaeta sp.]|nr:hypothetical protein [Sphaerochaeta sp.]